MVRRYKHKNRKLTLRRRKIFIVPALLLLLAIGTAAIIKFPSSSAVSADGPTKRLIVQLAGSSEKLDDGSIAERDENEISAARQAFRDEIKQDSGYTEVVEEFDNLPVVIVDADAKGEQSLKASSAEAVIEDQPLRFTSVLDSPITAIDGSPVNGFSDGSTYYDGTGQAIVIIDTGVDKNHPALTGKVIAEACFGVNSTDDDGNVVESLCPGGADSSSAIDSGMECVLDGCGHGTLVAGAAVMDYTNLNVDADTYAARGVASGAKIIAIKVASQYTPVVDDGSVCTLGDTPCAVPMLSSVLSALQYVYTNYNKTDVFPVLPKAVNLSLGGDAYGNTTSECSTSAGSTSYNSFNTAMSNLSSRSIATLVAAGNEGYNDKIAFPACVANAIAVAATDNTGSAITSYSNDGALVKLLAPGGDSGNLQFLPEAGTSDYVGAAGTSMATPMAAGAYAVVREKFPTATVAQITSLLQSTGATVDSRKLIQLDAALGYYENNPVAQPTVAINTFNGPSSTLYKDSFANFTGSASATFTTGVNGVSNSGPNCTLGPNGGTVSPASSFSSYIRVKDTTNFALSCQSSSSYMGITKTASDSEQWPVTAIDAPTSGSNDESDVLPDPTTDQGTVNTAPDSGPTEGGNELLITIPEDDYSSNFLSAATATFSLRGHGACVIDSSGELKCWGSGTGHSTPTKMFYGEIPENAHLQAIASSHVATCVLVDGDVYCWNSGSNMNFVNLSSNGSYPRLVSGGQLPIDAKFQLIAAGSTNDYACGVSSNEIYCWSPSTTSSFNPQHIDKGVISGSATITSIAVGNGHRCVIADGSAYCWGSNNGGQLGDGTTTNSTTPVAVQNGAIPNSLIMTAISAASVYNASGHTCAIMSNNKAYCWGHNEEGQLGDGTTTNSSVPVQVAMSGDSAIPVNGTFQSINAAGETDSGKNYSCAIVDNEAYCWGSNRSYGQLGIGVIGEDYPYPQKVVIGGDSDIPADAKFNYILSGESNVCAIATSDGQNLPYCWGEYNTLFPETGNKAYPTAISNIIVENMYGVRLGDQACIDVVIVSNTEISCTVPPHAAGTVDVVVRAGNVYTKLQDGYTYVGAAVAPTPLPSVPNTSLLSILNGDGARAALAGVVLIAAVTLAISKFKKRYGRS